MGSETKEPVIEALRPQRGLFVLEAQMDTFLATYLQTHTTLPQTSNFPLSCCLTVQFSNCLTFQAMVNREVGNPDVLDSYLGPDITAACQP